MLAKAFPQMRIAHVTYENLTAFEWMGGKGLEISTRAWWEVMASFGYGKSVSLDSVHNYLSKSDMFGSRSVKLHQYDSYPTDTYLTTTLMGDRDSVRDIPQPVSSRKIR